MSDNGVQGRCVNCGAVILWKESEELQGMIRVRDSHLCLACRVARFKR